MADHKEIIFYFLLVFLIGCDPFYLYLKPDVPEENLSKTEYSWAATFNLINVSFSIQGHIYSYVGDTYVIFSTRIVNTSLHTIKLSRDDISMSVDDSLFIQESIELRKVKVNNGKRMIGTRVTYMNDIIIDPGSTVFIEVLLRDDRLKTAWYPHKSITLNINAFQDAETGERIPLVIRFLKM
jgi:hypothetical protein